MKPAHERWLVALVTALVVVTGSAACIHVILPPRQNHLPLDSSVLFAGSLVGGTAAGWSWWKCRAHAQAERRRFKYASIAQRNAETFSIILLMVIIQWFGWSIPAMLGLLSARHLWTVVSVFVVAIPVWYLASTLEYIPLPRLVPHFHAQ